MPFGSTQAIVKERFRKAYRHPVLDERLTARRTIQVIPQHSQLAYEMGY